MLSENGLGNNIKKLMDEQEISQFRLSLAAEVPQSRISNILSGRVKNPRVATVSRLAKALGVTVDDLLSDPVDHHLRA